MAINELASILWRRVNKATLDTLTGQSNGQYDIRLNRPAGILDFLKDLPQVPDGERGGLRIEVPIEPFDGPNTVGAQVLVFRFMGEESKRGDWYIRAQRPESAYPLWRPNRQSVRGEKLKDGNQFLTIARDSSGRFHARWITEAGIASLPSHLKELMGKSEVGIYHPPAHTNSTRASKICAALEENFNVLIYGPPATGKSHILREVIDVFGASNLSIDTAEEKVPFSGSPSQKVRSKWVTFHQSYSYEDFVIGLRPEPSSDKLINLVPTPGLLLELAEWARQPGHASLLVIDEINRGNVSRIFGELITLLEVNKRLCDDNSQSAETVEVRLPYITAHQRIKIRINEKDCEIPNPFTLPKRVYILASMNSVDKAVAPLDTALRRRFHIVNLAPDLNEMARSFGLESVALPFLLPEVLRDEKDVKHLALALLATLNEHIGLYLGPEFMLGQWYFGALIEARGLGDAQRSLVSIWESRLLAQLEDLFQGRSEALAAVLKLDSFNDAPLQLIEPSDEQTAQGASPFLQRVPMPEAMTLAFLRHVAGKNISRLPS